MKFGTCEFIVDQTNKSVVKAIDNITKLVSK